MSTPAVVGILKDASDWSGVYVRYDGYLEGVGAALVRGLIDANGKVDPVANRAVSATQGWATLFEQPYGQSPASPCPRGVTPRNVTRADPAFVYLFDRSGVLHVFVTGAGNGSRAFAGLGAFDLVCSVPITADLELDVLPKSVAPHLIWLARFDATGWGSGAVERKSIADLLAREAEAQKLSVPTFRAVCRAELVELVRERLGPDDGPVAVRYGVSTVGLEVAVEGMKFWVMRDSSPAGPLELLQQSGKSTHLESSAPAAKPALASAARVILTRRPGWLLELLAWLRQETVPDPIKNHVPLLELRHADGRTWAIEAMQTQAWPEKAELTLSGSDADGDRFERRRDYATFDEAKRERERLVAEMIADGFAPPPSLAP